MPSSDEDTARTPPESHIHGIPQSLLQTRTLYDMRSIDVAEAIAREKAEDIEVIVTDVVEIHAMVHECSALTAHQGTKLDTVQTSLESARSDVVKGTDEIQKARKHRKRFLFF